MSKYNTKQRSALISYLSEHVDEQLSAKRIAAELASESISLSAVYRNLSELEAEGRVRRVSKGGSREVFYQFTDNDRCKGCLHLSCTRCGKTFHMDAAGTDLLIDHVAKEQKFSVNRTDTVIYGVCSDCDKK